MLIALTVSLAVVVGLALGLLGGGGSILMVPLLVYVAGMDAKEAIAASLVVVGVTAAVSVVGHARAGRVRWRTGLLFGLAGMAGAFAGGFIGGHLPGTVLLVAFALMMIATAFAMIRGREAIDPSRAHAELPVLPVLAEGVVVGLVTGLVGAGGGFLVVPALALLGGLPMGVAVGTSLLVIAMKSSAGLAGYLTTVPIDWVLTGAVTVAAVAGSLVGARLVGRIHADALRQAFGWFVLAMGAFVLVQQAPDGLRVPALIALAGMAVALAGCAALVPRCPLRHAGRRGARTAAPA
ncbi:sulfite exporter TauE/SafE family protein [Geodermatophilus marinus]|uniref:sulfite exporter TauE/SafE family protein n=1 Tax=Geodermatophilus sp. LHW52908 TaxID=2303986 RepID=UPI000E3D5346|nr:sulfite exporter TauE/SafE family protein [Geodermatophilus sp. LHW52908]RFU21734.1 sulfite exporter TauE/SafE family protein [Geodermatophilus sp. LHW52908]